MELVACASHSAHLRLVSLRPDIINYSILLYFLNAIYMHISVFPTPVTCESITIKFISQVNSIEFDFLPSYNRTERAVACWAMFACEHLLTTADRRNPVRTNQPNFLA
jgi:hypothetical protein